MELILNLTQYDYLDFINSRVNTIQIGLANFCVGYLKTYTIDDLPAIIKKIHLANKKVYLSVNIIANEHQIEIFQKDIKKLKSLNIDGFVIADFGIFQILKEENLTSKIVFNPVTNVTNKYASEIANNFGIDHCCLANELNIKDILEIIEYTNGNVELLAQGYYQICNSKRALLTNFFKKNKLKNNSKHYYIKEENRDYAYPILEINGETIIYIDKQRCILPYFKQLSSTSLKYIRIDSTFLSIDELNKHINCYNNILSDINTLDTEIENIQSYSNSNLKCLDSISILKKEKKNA